MALFEGNGLMGKAVNVEFGAYKGKPQVKWDMEVTAGPHAGKRASYKGKLDAESIKWTKRDMIAIGWQGKDVATFLEDVTKAAKVIEFTAEIVTWENKDTGKVSQWTAAKQIGFATRPLEKLEGDKVAEVNKWFAEAGEIGPQGGGKTDDSDLPFASCDIAHEPSPIASVLRRNV